MQRAYWLEKGRRVMPYIEKSGRSDLDYVVNYIGQLTPGELNYLITKVLLSQEHDCYSNFVTFLGTLEAVKLELYRRMIGPYEDKKKEENGDVF